MEMIRSRSSNAVWLFVLELYSPLAYVLSWQPRC